MTWLESLDERPVPPRADTDEIVRRLGDLPDGPTPAAEVVDQNGNKVERTGDASEGSGVVHPMATSFYVLRVTGGAGKRNDIIATMGGLTARVPH